MNNRILIIIAFIIPLSGVGIDIFTPSLPAMVNYFDVASPIIKASVAVYLIGIAIGQLFIGPVSDGYGRKRTVLIGLSLFLIFSLLATVPKDIYIFLLIRFLQGCVVTTSIIAAKSIVTDCFYGEAFKKASIYLVTAWSIGPIIAPMLGAYLQTYLGWKASFMFLAVYSLAAIMLIFILLPETNRHLQTFSFSKVKDDYINIINNKQFITTAICLSIGYSQIVIFSVVAPFIIQNILKYSPLTTGRTVLTMSLAFFVGCIASRIFVDYIKIEKIIAFGTLMMLMASMLLLWMALSYKLNLTMIIVPIFIIFYCVGVIYPNYSALGLSVFPKIAGSASGMMGVMTMLGAAVMSVTMSILETSTIIPLASIYLILSVAMVLLYIRLIKSNRIGKLDSVENRI